MIKEYSYKGVKFFIDDIGYTKVYGIELNNDDTVCRHINGLSLNKVIDKVHKHIDLLKC